MGKVFVAVGILQLIVSYIVILTRKESVIGSKEIIHKVLEKDDVITFILAEGKNKELNDFLKQKSGN